jgi:hypothetical protein
VSEEQQKENEQKVKTSKNRSSYFGIAAFVLGLFSFVIMLFFWIVILIDMSHCLYGVSEFWNNCSDILGGIVFLLFPPAVLFAFLALVIGFFAYYKIDRKESPLSKKLALWAVILSLFYWFMFYLQHTVWIPGYGW